MVFTNYWTGFFAESLEDDATQIKNCLVWTEEAVDHLLQYQKSLEEKKFFQSYIDWGKLATAMPAALEGCHGLLDNYSQIIWWTAFEDQEYFHDAITDAFASDMDNELRVLTDMQSLLWTKGRIQASGAASFKFWSTVEPFRIS